MKIIEPSVILLTPFDGGDVLKFLESCGRVCYRSENNITADSAENFIRNIIKRGHESILEHFNCTFKIICDRGVMAELTRHRLASFSVESTRYCDYSSDKFGGDLTFIRPCFWKENEQNFIIWENHVRLIEIGYKNLRDNGCPPEQARAILPNSLATTIIITANLREWRHLLKLRTENKAHPQMRQIANMILDTFKNLIPVVFEDF
jgi:thymidylate synthase (FAD)